MLAPIYTDDDAVSVILQCGNTYLEMPVVVHEFVHHAVSQEEMAPQPFSARSKLWRVLLPPDQLNPQGFVDARLDNFRPMEVCCAGGVVLMITMIVGEEHMHACQSCGGKQGILNLRQDTACSWHGWM